MKTIKYMTSLILLLLLMVGCEDENYEFGDIVAPINLSVEFEVVGQDLSNPDFYYGDGSGLVNFTVSADNAISYTFHFDDGSSAPAINGKLTHLFTEVGVNSYDVIVSANGRGGISTNFPMKVEVFSSFVDDEAKDFLSGGLNSSKTWFWAADQPGNIGLGPNEVMLDGSHTFPAWFFSNAFHPDKLCMYDAEMVFTQDSDGNLTFQQTVGQAYIPGTFAGNLGVDGDTCHGSDVVPSLGNQYDVALIPSSSIATKDGVEPEYRGTTIRFSDDGFMSWYIASSDFEIITITDNEMYVRVEEPGFAWYCRFQTTNPNEISSEDSFDTLVWEDDFEVDGAPDAANWNYNIGTGSNGWGNQESQYYTDRSDNVYISDGTLKIVAKTEDFAGSPYTSARIKTQDLFEFTYGRVDVRAKLPTGGGTWPAIWMLGANISDVGWPSCGEIDIMEHVGNSQNTIHNAIHNTSSSGDTVNTASTIVDGVSDEFHIYSVNWTEDAITFLIDDQVTYTYNPEEKTADNWPFTADQFIILNVAMGGTFGGNIDPAFTESIMEIDYVKVYQ